MTTSLPMHLQPGAAHGQCLNRSQFCPSPIQCEYYALEGLSQLVSTIAMVQEHLNPDLEWEGHDHV